MPKKKAVCKMCGKPETVITNGGMRFSDMLPMLGVCLTCATKAMKETACPSSK